VVAKVFVKPGTLVSPSTQVAQLENAALNAAVVDARSGVEAANAQLASAQEEARAASLTQQSSLAGAQAQMQEDSTNAESFESLHQSGLIANSTYRIAKIHADQSTRQLQISQAQISVNAAEQAAKVATARAQVDSAGAQLAAAESQVSALTVTAGASGIVESLAINGGSHVDLGGQVATIADRRALKAILQIPETQVRNVRLGMTARIDAGNGAVTGRVVNIAPAAENNTVAVDVALQRLPPGARPALSVDGAIEIARIPQRLSIARPAGAVDGSTILLYVLNGNDTQAKLTSVRLGRGSTDRVQVLAGLNAGDRVIVSDTSAYDGHSTLRLQ
jgi:HlyD family secretion protein